MRAVTAMAIVMALATPAMGQQESHPVVNVNTATAEQLTYLPGIGPKTADNLMYAREQGIRFESCGDLELVSGIGPKTAASICATHPTTGETVSWVVFDGPTTATAKLGSTSKTETKVKKIARPD